ncbi:immunoglobulin superfamily member 1-like [Myotis daubentonii]|uniref:immunoglobulin superfamily member 1-like n=1 Tax=Myotis daubentonii TaxID=98922 RepID=UPI0028732FFA|nr:immunoglobulin superfamily member 1-like [Myotis daubentonii]
MSPRPSTLLGLVLCLGQTIHMQEGVSQDGSQAAEARFHIPAVSEYVAGSYRCRYHDVFDRWSELSEALHLQVTEEDSTLPSGALPKPSLRSEPGPVVPRGRPVTFVCRGPAGAEFYHLEKEGRRVFLYHKGVSQDGLPVTEARFHIPVVSDMTAGSYRCLYEQVDERPSQPSEPLELKVTKEDFSTLHSGHTSQDYMVENSICLGLMGVALLILLAILV